MMGKFLYGLALVIVSLAIYFILFWIVKLLSQRLMGGAGSWTFGIKKTIQESMLLLAQRLREYEHTSNLANAIAVQPWPLVMEWLLVLFLSASGPSLVNWLADTFIQWPDIQVYKLEKDSYGATIVGAMTTMLVGLFHYLVRVQRVPKLLLSWPGYNRDEIKSPLYFSGIDLRVVECQQDYLREIIKGLDIPGGGHQIGALIIDQEQASELLDDHGWRITTIPNLEKGNSFFLSTNLANSLGRVNVNKSVQLLCDPIGNDFRLMPVRFGFNGICWDKDQFAQKAALAAACAPDKPVYYLKSILNDLLSQKVEVGRPRPVAYYDWWYLQMLLHAKLAWACCQGSPRYLSKFIANLRFNHDGTLEGALDKDWQYAPVWECMKRSLVLMKNGGQRFDNFIEMRKALVGQGPPYVALGPGDSFVGEETNSPLEWGLLGSAGGLLWVECLGFLGKLEKTKSDKPWDSVFDERQRKLLVNLIKHDHVQRAVCDNSESGFYANSPHNADLLRNSMSNVVQNFCRDKGDPHPHSLFECLDKLIADELITIRPDIGQLLKQNWKAAYDVL